MSVEQSLHNGYERWGVAIASSFLQIIIILFLTLLFIIPGVIWEVYYAFLYQAVALTDFGPKKTLDYSKYIVLGNWWRVLGNLLAISLIPILISFGFYEMQKYLTAMYEDFKYAAILFYTVFNILNSFIVVGMTVLFRNMESIRLESEDDITLYGMINKFVHKDSAIELDTEDSVETNNEDEDALRCSVCGIMVNVEALICPMCRSVIRKNIQAGKEDVNG